MVRKTFTLLAFLSSCCTLTAQTTASGNMATNAHAPIVAYNISDQGVEQPVRWGIDTAWRWSWWPLRATNHMKECVSLGRVTIDPRVSGNNTSLTSDQKSGLDEQLGWLVKAGVTDLYLLAGNASGTAWSTSYRTAFINDIALAVEYLQNKGYSVVAISPFNEPDYGANNAPSASEMAVVANLMHQNETLKDIDVAGPSCLNPDYAYSWWNTMKEAVDIGNTHQLAGSFDNFANFYAVVQSDGKKSAGDELHNINDALVGMNYGMSAGIWWSDFGGYTRAELGRTSNNGTRIAYRENRNAWTTAAVFKCGSENLVEAFLGTSERQAGESAFTFVSQDRLAYYDGNGPYYEYTKATKGGTGYQVGQTNSECVIEITYGEDVPVGAITGSFKIVNKATGRLLTANNLSNNSDVGQSAESAGRYQTWNIKPLSEIDAGDFSYVTITCSRNTLLYLDGVKYGGDNGARVLVYQGGGNECERWHLRYMGDGYYVITNHDSGLSLEGSSDNSSSTTTGVVQWERTGSDRQLWHFVPADATVDQVKPTTPTGLNATPLSASVRLSWNANSDNDLLGYMIYRYNESARIWETIARQVTDTVFIDNMSPKDHTFRYRIRAVDKAWNVSEPSTEVSCRHGNDSTKIAHWKFASDLNDICDNRFDAVGQSIAFESDGVHDGITFNGTDSYVNLPYNVGDMPCLTFCAWVNPNSATAWQRIFDFGNSTDNYMFLTPSNGSRLRFEICHDGDKQGLNATKRLATGTWTFVALTIDNDSVKIYLNGDLNAASGDIAYRPDDVNPLLSYIGMSMFDADPMFSGMISDVSLYNYALSADSIKRLYYSSQTSSATDLLAQPMYKNTRQSLQKALDNVNAAITDGNTDGISTLLSTLNTAMQNAQKSISAYQPLGQILAWSRQTATEHPQDNTSAQSSYDAAYNEAETYYKDGEYSNARISLQVADVRTFTNRYVMTDATSTATEDNPIDISYLLINDDFESGTSDYWTITSSTSGYKGNLGYGCIEFSTRTFNIFQSLGGMPSGTYRLSTQGFYRNGAKENSADTEVNSFIYIGSDNSRTLTPISRNANTKTSSGDWYEYANNKFVPDDLEAASAAFNNLSRFRPSTLFNLNYVDGYYDSSSTNKLVAGIKKTTSVTDDWTVVNYFKLYYLGDPDSTAAADVNHDGNVDTQDVLTIYDGMRTGTTEGLDVNGDGMVDTQDVLTVYEYMRDL